MRITVVGIGYVGLSLAILLSQYNKVILVDIAKDKVNSINDRKSPIRDHEIEEYLQTKDLALSATTDQESAFLFADYVIIATPTNYDAEKNYFDTSTVETVICSVRKCNTNAVIIIKSTVPVGYTESIRLKYQDERILFSPEFLRESKALYDNLYPSRIIIGCPTTEGELFKKANEFIQLLVCASLKENVDTCIMGLGEAEAVKLFSNTYLALRVSYFNELDTYAEMKGLNTRQIIEGVCLDPRIQNHYNNPSFGYGGYCLPKDTKQLLANYKDVPEELIRAIVESNQTRKKHIAERIIEYTKNKLHCENDEEVVNRSVIGLYRLVMKTNSDNFRESSILSIVTILKKRGFKMVIYEPDYQTGMTYDGVRVEKSLDVFKKSVDVIVANRVDDFLNDVLEKVYTRDLFMRD